MLPLVLADRNDVGAVEQDVAGHQHRVGEECSGDEVLVLRFLLELRHPSELAVARHRRQQPSRLGMRGHMALDEHGRALRIEPRREEHRCDVERPFPQRGRIVLDRDRVQVDNAEERLASFLRLGVLPEASAEVPDVRVTAGLDTAEDPH